MTYKFSYYERQQLKQLRIECEILGLNSTEGLEYITSKFGKSISREYYFNLKQMVEKGSEKRLNDLKHSRYAYLYQYFQRIDEIKKYQTTLWEDIKQHEDDGLLVKACISELHQLTITLANLYEMLPEYSSTLAANTQTITQDNTSQSEQQETSQRVFA